MTQLQNTNNKLTVVSLFSGAGGLDIAVCRTGRVGQLFSTDANSTFLQTTINNMPIHFPDVVHKHMVSDATLLRGTHVCEKLNTDRIDLLFGGPPCDDFTSIGRKRGLSGDKAPLIFEFARLVNELQPKAFIFENVPSLKQIHAGALDQLMIKLEDAGYTLSFKILESQAFGVPSIRKRLFIVGFNKQITSYYNFPDATHGIDSAQTNLHDDSLLKPYIYVRDVLNDLPDTSFNSDGIYHNHTGRPHRPGTIEHLKSVPQGVQVKKSYRYRAPWNGLCNSLTAGEDNACKSYIHPNFHREMSVREYARIHGFPDSWFFSGTHHNGIKQVANAVPIPLAESVLHSVVICLD